MPAYICPEPDCSIRGQPSSVRRHYARHCDDATLRASGLLVRCPVSDCAFMYSRLSPAATRSHFNSKHGGLDIDAHPLLKAEDRDDQGRKLSDCLAEILPEQFLQISQPQVMELGPGLDASSSGLRPDLMLSNKKAGSRSSSEIAASLALLRLSQDSAQRKDLPQDMERGLGSGISTLSLLPALMDNSRRADPFLSPPGTTTCLAPSTHSPAFSEHQHMARRDNLPQVMEPRDFYEEHDSEDDDMSAGLPLVQNQGRSYMPNCFVLTPQDLPS